MTIREVRRSALVTFTPEQMFDLVVDVERYPEFLPWVQSAELHQKAESELLASLGMQRGGRRERFTTRNVFERPGWMSLSLVEGPFRVLEGRWAFEPIGEAGTRIDLQMRFEFSSAVVSLVFGRSFEQSCGTLIDAFVARARGLYGGA
ncbi:MAG TPA: type II toxin-antitoxin system RatA family toxin [Steroidobacteraceae bacterium]|nr:type II toxin-antitoxin system RatA family toxin [Steroidobacteraceae bacterium]